MKSTRISNPRIIPTFTVYDTTQMHVVVYLWVRILVGLSKINKVKSQRTGVRHQGLVCSVLLIFIYFLFFYVDYCLFLLQAYVTLTDILYPV